ncbi:MAG TPA: MTAP family purine nucleoside phosphorylase [Methanospirillum sp.]|nr:MTAP family purine nucleoside phosphorylase [Methanospirillum sp.]
MLGIIGGTSLLELSFTDWKSEIIDTPYGSSTLLVGDNVVLLQRHQKRRSPHRINYRSHIGALALAGVDRIIAIGSTGSLNSEIAPGNLVIPDDYLTLQAESTIFNHSVGHVKPEFSRHLREALIKAIPEARGSGTYIQTSGPRIETAAEIRWLRSVGDIVGMTLASEATTAREMNIPFAAICTVDNFANGIGKEEVTYAHIVTNARLYSERTRTMVDRVIQSCTS